LEPNEKFVAARVGSLKSPPGHRDVLAELRARDVRCGVEAPTIDSCPRATETRLALDQRYARTHQTFRQQDAYRCGAAPWRRRYSTVCPTQRWREELPP
jgi:hypothetical protein